MQAVCLGRCEARSGLFSDVWELSTRDSVQKAAAKGRSIKALVQTAAKLRDLKPGGIVDGCGARWKIEICGLMTSCDALADDVLIL